MSVWTDTIWMSNALCIPGHLACCYNTAVLIQQYIWYDGLFGVHITGRCLDGRHMAGRSFLRVCFFCWWWMSNRSNSMRYRIDETKIKSMSDFDIGNGIPGIYAGIHPRMGGKTRSIPMIYQSSIYQVYEKNRYDIPTLLPPSHGGFVKTLGIWVRFAGRLLYRLLYRPLYSALTKGIRAWSYLVYLYVSVNNVPLFWWRRDGRCGGGGGANQRHNRICLYHCC